jgi:hypothetical protein
VDGGGGVVAAGTVTLAVPVLPSLVALITAVPVATAVTAPAEETVATAMFELAHVTARPLRVAVVESRGVAVNAADLPIATVAVSGATFTEATEATGATGGTGTGGTAVVDTRTLTVPTAVPIVAVTVVVPAAMPVILPADTFAIVVSALDHTAR